MKNKNQMLKPPQEVADAAQRGIELQKEHGRGGSDIAIDRATRIAAQESLPISEVVLMKGLLTRQEITKEIEPDVGNGKISWLLLGGDAGQKWANEVCARVEEVKKYLCDEAYEPPTIDQRLEYTRSPAGANDHSLDRRELEAMFGGYHVHVFMIPAAGGLPEYIWAEYDGGHRHEIENSKSLLISSKSSEHRHILKIQKDVLLENGETLKAGDVLLSELDGAHSHNSSNAYCTNMDGSHVHSVKLPGGLVAKSMSLTEVIDLIVTEKIGATVEVLKEKPLSDWDDVDMIAKATGHTPVVSKIIKESSIKELLFYKEKFSEEGDVATWLADRGFKSDLNILDAGSCYQAEVNISKDRKYSKPLTLSDGVNIIVFDEPVKKEKESPKEGTASTTEAVIKGVDKEKQVVLGIVLEPDVSDHEGDTITAEEIEQSAHDYMQKSRVVKFRHKKVLKSAKVVESFIAPADMTIDGPHGKQKVRKGSWVLGVKIEDSDLWADVKAKRINGFSVGGLGVRTPV